MNPLVFFRQFNRVRSAFAALIVLSVLSLSIGSLVEGSSEVFAADKDSGVPITLDELKQAITDRRNKTPEFEFIRQQAEKIGVRVWLFGGTAAAYGHYVKWDLQREKGDARFQKERFDYDYTNIYRSTQDLDIVIDGTPEQASRLRNALAETYPHFLGSKTQWEVRLLRSALGAKEALLGNPDFLNQHTDSNSVGMVELTHPPAGEEIVRDLRDWTSKEPAFFKDLRDGELHYYFSKLHANTSRAQKDLNPPIFSVIRYLTKAFQYDLEIRPEDEPLIRKIIDEFDPKRDLKSEYAKDWFERNAKKIFQNAVNLDHAASELDRLGLRRKLIGFKNDISKQDSLAWWINRKPLQSRPLGTRGETAAEVFKQKGFPDDLVVAHDTREFLAYESITRAHTGEPNVFVSRQNAVGEAAVHGEGFYTRVGRQGAVGSGKTIRFKLDPKARLGADFDLAGDFVVVKNKRTLRVIPESLNWSVLEYFRFLADGEKIGETEQALIEKLKRRVGNQFNRILDEEYKEIAATVGEGLKKRPYDLVLWNAWYSLPKSRQFEADVVNTDPDFDLRKKILSSSKGERVLVSLRFLLPTLPPERVDEFIEQAIQYAEDDLGSRGFSHDNHFFRREIRAMLPDILRTLIQSKPASAEKTAARWVKFISEFTDNREHSGSTWSDLATALTKHPELASGELLKHAIASISHNELIPFLDRLLEIPNLENRPALMVSILSGVGSSLNLTHAQGTAFIEKISRLLETNPAWRDPSGKTSYRPSAKYGTGALDKHWKMVEDMQTFLLKQDRWKSDPKLISDAIASGVKPLKAQDVLDHPEFSSRPEWIDFVMSRYGRDPLVDSVEERLREILARDSSHGWIERAFQSAEWKYNREYQLLIGRLIYSTGAAFQDPSWVNTAIQLERFDADWLKDVYFADPRSARYPEQLLRYVVKVTGPKNSDRPTKVLQYPHWRDHPELRKLCNGKPTVKCLFLGKPGFFRQGSACAGKVIGKLRGLLP